MAKEIERKFLVIGDIPQYGTNSSIFQGYLCRDKERTVRIRIEDEDAYITVKGKTEGISRDEFEYSIPVDDAAQMLLMCDGLVIYKNRRVIINDIDRWEIDYFHRENQGLVVAEIELVRPDQKFKKPAWLGEEVTYDPRYANSNLSIHPFSEWM